MRSRRSALLSLRVIVAAAVLGGLAAFTFVGALHSPAPHEMDVGLVGSPAVTGPVDIELEQQAPSAYDVHPYPTRAAAVQAILDRDIAAAYVPGGRWPELLLAGANGAMQATSLTVTFNRVADRTGSVLVVDDLRPARSDDRAGLSPFLLVVSLTIPGLVLGVLISTIGSQAGLDPARRLGAAAAGAAAVGLANTLVADLVLDALTGHFWAVWGIASLLVLALTTVTVTAHGLLGRAGLALAFVVFLVVGMPTTGAAIGPSFLPDALRVLTLVLPAGEAVPALRSVEYFGGADSATPLCLLGAWSVGAALLLLVASRALPRARGERAREVPGGLGAGEVARVPGR